MGKEQDNKIKINKEDLKIRKSWPTQDFDPSTKVHKTEKDYTRKHSKKAIEDALLDAEDAEKDLENWL